PRASRRAARRQSRDPAERFPLASPPLLGLLNSPPDRARSQGRKVARRAKRRLASHRAPPERDHHSFGSGRLGLVCTDITGRSAPQSPATCGRISASRLDRSAEADEGSAVRPPPSFPSLPVVGTYCPPRAANWSGATS